jgi:hypothetical protein
MPHASSPGLSLAPAIPFVRGRTVTEFDPSGNPTLLRLTGHMEDLCAALANP